MKCWMVRRRAALAGKPNFNYGRIVRSTGHVVCMVSTVHASSLIIFRRHGSKQTKEIFILLLISILMLSVLVGKRECGLC